MTQKIVCQRCKYYYITWDKNRPHGCKAYNFKSNMICSTVVKKNSGVNCTLFQKKQIS